jgi:uncharacterized protein (TIGR02996 family)
MDEREREFRAAILDTPDDIAPRLVFADWLQERGDPRGEWIALDCAPATGDETREMRRRALWQHHRAQWFRDDLSTELDRKIEYRNGFVHTVRLNAEQLLPLGKRMAEQPIDTLDVMCIPATMAALAECSVLPRLRRLNLGNRFDDVDATSAVLDAATKIVELALHRAHGSTDERAAWHSLERYKRFAELEVIELGSIPTSAGRARWLAEQLPRVHTLRLVSAVDAEALRTFVELLPKLEHLHIRNAYGTVIHDDLFADAIAALPSLKTLTLDTCGLGERTAAQLSRLSLTELAINGQRSPKIVAGLANCTFPELATLDISENEVPDDLLEHLGRFPKLTTLRANKNPVTARGAQIIAARAPQLTSLDLDDTRIGDAGFAAIATLPLRTLHVRSAELTDKSIGIASKLRGLRELYIGSYPLREALAQLANAPLDKLEHLDVRGIEALANEVYFGEGWIEIREHIYERRLELTGTAVPNKPRNRAGAAEFDRAGTYEYGQRAHHPDYGIGIVRHAEPVRVDIEFPDRGLVKLGLRPESTTAFDPDATYQMSDVIEHPTYGVGIVLLVAPEQIHVRLATGEQVTLRLGRTVLDRVRKFFK